MAEAMGGSLSLERDVTRGVTVFTLRLPLFPGVSDASLLEPQVAAPAPGHAAVAVAAAGRVQVSPLNQSTTMPALATPHADTTAPVVRLLQACEPPVEAGLAHGVLLSDLVEPARCGYSGATHATSANPRSSALAATRAVGGSLDERSAVEVVIPPTPGQDADRDGAVLLPLVAESKQSPIVTSGAGQFTAGHNGAMPSLPPPPPVLLPIRQHADAEGRRSRLSGGGAAGAVAILNADAANVGDSSGGGGGASGSERERSSSVHAEGVSAAAPVAGPVIISSHGGGGGAVGGGRTARGSASSASKRLGIPPLALHVLYADDELINTRIMERMLQKLGCTCVCVNDGVDVGPALVATGQLRGGDGAGDGVSRLPGRPYDVVLLDLVMRGQGGVQTCRQLRAAGITLPIIACTGDGEAAVKSLGFTAGLVKPFTHDKLEAVLRAVAAPAPVALLGGGVGDAE